MASVLWAAIAVLFFTLVFATGMFDLFFLAIAALLVAGASLILPGFADMVWLQVLCFAAGGFFSLLVFRSRFKKLFRGEELRLSSDDHAGKTAHVTEAIGVTGEGRISFQGTTWPAMANGEVIPVGATVYILEQTDAHFVVTAHRLDEIENDEQPTSNP